ncbi:hypothetical protein [Actinokineospora sp.]|uniref:hypothetical protein n=1 Tax=Actinokineospora sp. TaxID=1872133 RepID=UPI0040376475
MTSEDGHDRRRTMSAQSKPAGRGDHGPVSGDYVYKLLRDWPRDQLPREQQVVYVAEVIRAFDGAVEAET